MGGGPAKVNKYACYMPFKHSGNGEWDTIILYHPKILDLYA